MMEYEYFKLDEFKCKCCGANNIFHGFVTLLDIARGISGVPYIITSGYRCQKHNDSLTGSVSDSAHVNGLAADIKVSSLKDRYAILEGLFAVRFRRIGIAKDFIHVDIDSSKTQNVIWLYGE